MNLVTKKHFKLLFLLLWISPALKLRGQSLLGIWSGTVNQNSIIYNYSIDIKKIIKDSIFGHSVTSNKKFYCQTKFKGIIIGNKILIQETSIIKTNFKSAGSICLMKINLIRKNVTLTGEFSSSSKEIKECGSGTVSLQIIKEKKDIISSTKESTTTLKKEVESSPEKVTLSKPEELPRTTITAPIKINDQRKIEKREIELLNTFKFREDSVMIKVYDNGVIDGDVISLIINGQIVFDKIKLTTTPLAYVLKASSETQYQVEFYAETLGEIPPNTGLISISSATKTSEVLFSSDLKKSAAIKVLLNNIPK